DKLIFDTYGDTITLKRRQDDDKDEEPSVGSNRGSNRTRAGKELKSTIAPKEKTSKTIGKSTEGSKSHYKYVGKSALAEELMHTTKEFMQINQFAEAISLILSIVDKYLDHQMNEAVKVAVQLQSDKLRDEAQAKNKDFLNKLDENI
nr:hypothetical protein [Tanacetum cinerariifolium]